METHPQKNKFMEFSIEIKQIQKISVRQQQNKKILHISAQLQQIKRKFYQQAQAKVKKDNKIRQGNQRKQYEKITKSKQQTNLHAYNNNINNQIPIAIFQNSQINNQGKVKKRKSSKSSVNFHQGLPPIFNNPNQSHRSYYMYDDNTSVDTYQMEIGQDYRMPNLQHYGGLRKSLLPAVKVQDSIQVTIDSHKMENQNQKFSSSMGGKRFSHIVNLLKPQFQPKRSNIFQEPQNQNEEDSKKSISLKKSISSRNTDQQSLQKRKRKLFNTQSHIDKGIKGLKTLEQFKNQLKQMLNKRFQKRNLITISTDKNQFSPQKIFTNASYALTPTSDKQKQSNKQKSNIKLTQNNKQIQVQKYVQYMQNRSALNKKIKEAVQRTNRAIQLLNKVKFRKRNSTFSKKFSFVP